MFKKILVANRGEIAVRVIRACHELGISAVALYEEPDRDSQHIRMADEVVRLEEPSSFNAPQAILRIALEKGVDAIHPGYGFLAERDDFIRSCQASGIAFIGPPAEVVESARQKILCLNVARQAGIPAPVSSSVCFDAGVIGENGDGLERSQGLYEVAGQIGYPLVVKSCRGGRGRGERMVASAEHLERAVRRSQAEALKVYGDAHIYLEKLIWPAHQIGVQILGDSYGNLIHLGEREGSILVGNQKIFEESPAPCLNAEQRAVLWETALRLARLFGLQNAGTVEFLMDQDGQLFFLEIKPRIQIEHPVTETLARVDLVQEQIRIAAGEPLSLRQEDVKFFGWAMLCRVAAEDAWNRNLPCPGRLSAARFPSGPEVRVDTYVEAGCEIPAEYDALIAKLTVWAPDRSLCLERMQRALREFNISGIGNNLSMLWATLTDERLRLGCYDTQFSAVIPLELKASETYYRDLAAAAGLLYWMRNRAFPGEVPPTVSPRLQSGWHRASRNLE